MQEATNRIESENHRRRAFFGLWAAAALALAGVVPSEAQAGGFELFDPTGCFSRSMGSATPNPIQDPDDGNYWARHDVFTVDMEEFDSEGCYYFGIDGLSLLLKTPFEIDVTPTDVDDIDVFDDFDDLRTALLEDEDYDPFDHYGANFFHPEGTDDGNPDPGEGATWTGASVCISTSAITIADCVLEQNGVEQILLIDVMGQMIFSTGFLELDFFYDWYYCEYDGENGKNGENGECQDTLHVVTIARSNLFDDPFDGIPPTTANLVPEMMIGFNFTPLPEPSVVWLLGPALLLAARRRRSRA